MLFKDTDHFLVTGASSGIGLAIGQAIIKNGGIVVGIARDEKKLIDAYSDSVYSNHFFAEPRDLSCDIDQLQRWVIEISNKYGKLKALVLCAGIRYTKPLKVISYEAFSSRVVSCDDDPNIVVMSSIVALNSNMGLCDYGASKAALLNSVKSLALELAPRIRVNAILPGFVDTDMIQKWQGSHYEEFKDSINNHYPLGIGKPEYIADACLFLLSDKARWITGTGMIVDGGASLLNA